MDFALLLQCVAKPSSDEATLTAHVNYACSQVDCKVLQKGNPCFYPDNLMSHASVAMNLYYQARGRNYWNCHFKNSGLVTITDPSNFPVPCTLSSPLHSDSPNSKFDFSFNSVVNNSRMCFPCRFWKLQLCLLLTKRANSQLG